MSEIHAEIAPSDQGTALVVDSSERLSGPANVKGKQLLTIALASIGNTL